MAFDTEAVKDLIRQGYTNTEIAKKGACNRSTAIKIRAKMAAEGEVCEPRSAETMIVDTSRKFVETDDGKAVLDLHTDKPIKTLADAIKAAEVDESIWYVESWETSHYTVPMNVKKGQRTTTLNQTEHLAWNPSQPIITQMHRVRMRLKRIIPRDIKEAMDLVLAEFRKVPLKGLPPLPKARVKSDPYMAVFGLFDVHFGKLCWAPETGSDYDLKIADAIFRNAVEDLVAESVHRNIDKVLLPIGNDWLHIDNRNYTTTRGTRQDTDGRFSKVFAAAKLAAVWAVERLALLAPVEVVWVPGNHDQTLSEMLCHIIDARFHLVDRVTVNIGAQDRKYIQYGTTLVGLTHGDKVKPEDLPGKMAAESPKKWADTKCREWLIGHQHRSRKWVTKPTDTYDGTVVRVLQSLAGTDAWHYEMGYINTRQAAEVYWYSKTGGYTGHSVVTARTEAP